jgi:tRNA(fMet)-specific endonuclease VapC
LSYLLDTNACIALINGRPATVRKRLRQITELGEQIVVPSIAAFELWYGVGKSARPETNAERLAIFLGRYETLSLDLEDARFAGLIRAELEKAGTPSGAYDTLIAGQAMRHRMILVTANVGEFDRIAGLHAENWAASPA